MKQTNNIIFRGTPALEARLARIDAARRAAGSSRTKSDTIRGLLSEAITRAELQLGLLEDPPHDAA